MPRIVSAHFGEIDCPEEALLEFPEGIPAFEQHRRFAVIEPPATAPVVFLQSLSDPDLCLITLPVTSLVSGYTLSMTLEDLLVLGLDRTRQPVVGEEVVCLAIVTIPRDRRATANLLAPVVIDRRTRRAVQAIQADSPYSHRHPLTAGEEGAC